MAQGGFRIYIGKNKAGRLNATARMLFLINLFSQKGRNKIGIIKFSKISVFFPFLIGKHGSLKCISVK